ncbi:HD domain-containing protein [Nocardia pseudobrasiliensis]|uniref:Metal dependent phosphohydrolase n=1 Tax=Nocardia pseudobrasiliensis TaxID=45979 RepID=A0A370HU80_9NOCA|nr:HD domain-containing protein [Nocardia pseudobrasiliensis]RDI60514.1 metal dependent phosphohydrolase [Nocardia pseudobrasiliensis]
MTLPSTPLADKASDLIDRTLTPHLRNHSVRGFLFGRAAAAHQGFRPGIDYDEEIMYLICALHDLGLSENANGDQRFEVDGADHAAQFLEDNGVTDSRVDIVWDAIAAHTSGFIGSPVYRRRRPPEIWIAVAGIGIDVGFTDGGVSPEYATLVHHAYPRLGGSRAMTQVIETQALANPRKASPGTLAADIIHSRHPSPLHPTWDMVLDSSIWRD